MHSVLRSAGTTRVRCLVVSGLLLAALWAPGAQAALGQAPGTPATTLSATPSTLPASAASSPAAPPQWRATTPHTGTALYSLSSTVLDTGTEVREYTTPAGVVFAVAWKGPTLPDLEALLGNYFGTFHQQVQASHATRGIGTPLNFQATDLVVHAHGRMRHFSGYAYVPSLLPSGVNINDVLH